MSLNRISARIVQGHQVASGLNGNPRFPGGTLRMQQPHFQKRGLDLSVFYVGTINIRIGPFVYQVLQPKLTFRQVQWHPSEPDEDFSFFDVSLFRGEDVVHGLIYYPHPETKPEHFQPPDALELLMPFIPGLAYGDTIDLRTNENQMVFHVMR
ncbi:MAG: hypothetical protein ACK58L_10255 [Planctomycetota bacterium]